MALMFLMGDERACARTWGAGEACQRAISVPHDGLARRLAPAALFEIGIVHILHIALRDNR
ncbi:hypothetical protein M3A49_13490 [Paraburkholderia sp. CNPSo 3076]|uniref:hypothetical protein n=1 Tax=Paraburkholderia sp. CNPSo 3076 TaxID=2940936 RepID=UPI00225AAFE2|nr:hypothetical protein [Paraburkholderia sp. CNPSo 3076]MCX5540494.1 hypothetical protein [Paraburkholderia sp. CNPSo 3076]